MRAPARARHGAGARGAEARGELAPEDIRDASRSLGGARGYAPSRARLAETFPGIDIKHGVDPDTAVAEGAARSYAC